MSIVKSTHFYTQGFGQGGIDQNPLILLNRTFFFDWRIIYGVYPPPCQLQMTLSLRPLDHIRGNFTHITIMIHIFDADVSIDIADVDIRFRLRPQSAREMGRMAMINISLGSQSTRNFIWDENF